MGDGGAPVDVVVVGAGGAGLATAVEAGTRGARVVLIEKQPHIGGMLHIANGEMSGSGTARQRARGITDSPREHLTEVLALSHGRCDRDLAWLSIQSQGDTVDWLDQCGFQFHPESPGLIHGHETYSIPRTYWGVDKGLSVLRVLSGLLDDLVASGRVRVMLGTRVTSLVTERGDNGSTVCGVTVDHDGHSIRIVAPAVVLASGGYEANLELRNAKLPPGCANALVGCLDHATGDGALMAVEIGADMSGDGYFIPVMGLIPDPDRPGWAVDYRKGFVQLPPAYREPYELWVNATGRRFVAEDCTSPELRERALLDQPNLTMHIIWDRRIAEVAQPLLWNVDGAWSRDAMRAELDGGRLVARADRLDDLARSIAVDPQVLRSTVAGYNEAVDTGRDVAFGRTALPLAIGAPPFYALTTVAASLLSRDGLRIDRDTLAVRSGSRSIPGLYAVGEILGNNVFAGDNYVGGMSITPALTLGRLLGRRLAALSTG